MIRNERGQTILVCVIALMLAIALTTPAVIKWMEREAVWSVKTLQNTRAEEMAELGLDLGFQTLVQSSTTWNAAVSGTILPGFNFDVAYQDVGIGTYAVKITSGPGPQQATITSVGREKFKKETWGIRMVVQNATSQTALYAGSGLTFKGNAQVDWGPLVVFGALQTDTGHLHPRLISDGSLTPIDIAADVPNTDNIQWWSYQAHLPAAPQIDIDGYISAAKAGGAGHYNAGGGPYHPALGNVSGTYYFDGDVVLDAANPLFLQGDLIVKGNLTVLGAVGTGTVMTSVPPTAWLDYGNDWATYQGWDAGAPTTFPGSGGIYVPTSLPTISVSQALMRGFLYVERQLVVNDSPGIQVPIVGSVYIGENSNLNLTQASFHLYFDPTVANTVKTRNVPLTRKRWENLSTCQWTGAFPICL